LKSSFLLASYDDEHILHGSIGFLLDVYTEHTFGVEESRYQLFSFVDCVSIEYCMLAKQISIFEANGSCHKLRKKQPILLFVVC